MWPYSLEMCNCFGEKEKSDEGYGLYDQHSDEEWDDLEESHESLTSPSDDLIVPPDETHPNDIQIVITESPIISTKKEKNNQLKSMLKRIKTPLKSVRFHSEKSSLVKNSLDTLYASTGSTLHRTFSTDSFASGVSSVTTNFEEFGEELSPCRVQVFIHYDPKEWVLVVGAKQAQCFISTNKDKMYWQVHMTLLPFKKDRYKSRYKSTSTPIFNESFQIHKISSNSLNQISVRYRIYGRVGRTGRKKLAGETDVELSMLTRMKDNTLKDWRVLKRKTVPLNKRESNV
ncbi:synaptotagmin-14 [Hydra vulgaris]|uniref:Synaptotagmin-14 n=1 Tax=Hydra vulgaris TaxID=6087 RepID=A0ABM4CJD9_HYDVU